MKKKIILESVSNIENNLCVDIFERSDNSFGFEEYRRDLENNEGWFKIGFFEDYSFKTKEEALSTATEKISWFNIK